VDKALLDIALTTKPLDKMNLKVAYRIQDHDNKTPSAWFRYAGRDATTQGALGGSSVRQNAPLSTKERKFTVDADYQIADRTTLRATFENKKNNYTPADREETENNKITLDLRRPISDEFLGNLTYSYDQRRGTQYNKNVYFRSTYDPAYIGANFFTQHPAMRSFLFNDYDEHRVRASGNWTATETLSLQGGLDTFKRLSPQSSLDCTRYADSLQATTINVALGDVCLGRTLAEGLNANVDLQWQPEENLTVYSFLSFAMTGTEQRGLEFSAKDATAVNSERLWKASLTNFDNTLGFGLKWQPQEQWDLGGNYVFNRGVGMVDVATGNSAANNPRPGTPLPKTESALHTLQLFAKWNYSKQLTWRFNYWYEHLNTYDWAYDDLAPISVRRFLMTGQDSPRYQNHVVGVSAAIHSW
jgi:hypothetical protein